MKYLTQAVFLFALLTRASSGVCQPSVLPSKTPHFNPLPQELGLSQSSINCILQDHEGYLWIGTWSGLILYDGYTTTVFHSGNSITDLKSNLIAALYEDHRGLLWVGTHVGGLYSYDKHTNTFTSYTSNPNDSTTLSNNNIWSIAEDEIGNLWIATENGLNYFDREKQNFKRVYYREQDPLSLNGNFVTDVLVTTKNDVWVGTSYGVGRMKDPHRPDSGFDRFIDEAADPSENFIHKLVEINIGDESKVWYISNKGINTIDDGTIVSYSVPDSPEAVSMFRTMLTINGKSPLILLGSSSGLEYFDPVKRSFIKTFDGINQRMPKGETTFAGITELFLDRGGVLWAGTKKGIYKADSYDKDFERYPTSGFDKSNSIITSIQPADDNAYWVSTMGGGLFHFSGKEFNSVALATSVPGYQAIQSLFRDSYGDLWVGTSGAGIFHIPSHALDDKIIKEFDHYASTTQPSIPDNYIVTFEEDLDGAVWIGTWNSGLIRIDRERHITLYQDSLLTKAPIVVLQNDHAGSLWIGTRGNGVYRLRLKGNYADLKHFANVQANPQSLCNNFVNAILEDHAGELWFATEGGLTAFDRRTETFRQYPLNSGPVNNVIAGMLEDDNGKLWLAHWNGITVVDPADTTGRVMHFGEYDGIQGGFFYSNVTLKDKSGLLLLGGSNGLNRIDPDHIRENPFQPPVVIREFRIFNKPVLSQQPFNDHIILHQSLSETDEVHLKYTENNLSFDFAALDFAAPSKLRYAYKLEGFDRDWNYTTADRRFANYTNVNPGTYVFSVKTTNSDGIWSDHVTRLTVVIAPPWWKTVWAFGAYVIVALVMLYLFRKLILLRANFLHDLKLERVQRENNEKLNQAKLKFFTNISHELRTPLTLIIGPLQDMLDKAEANKFFRNQLLTINTNAQRLMRLVNELLDFRKVESGNLDLHVAEGNLVKFVKEIKLSFQPLAEKLNVDLQFQSSSNVIKAWFDRDQFEKIIFNLLSNAFKHTVEGGRIVIQLIERENHVAIVVEDNGSGIPQEHFEQIFQSFFSYDEARHQSGTGLGLALTKSLVQLHKGEITVDSKEREYCRFTITLPLGHDHFNETQLHRDFTDSEEIAGYPEIQSEALSHDEDTDQLFLAGIDGLPVLLIVEDNDEVRSYIKSVFKSRFVILEAENGKEGLQLALEEVPDIIISDVMMPVMDGIRFCKEIKCTVETSHIPVLLLSARTSLIFKVEGLETGADDYITKPFNPAVLKLKVKNILQTRDAIRKTFDNKDTLRIEPSRVTLTSPDERFIKQALESVEAQIANPEYTVEDLGRDIGMSRMQLYRKLKALTGQSANEFIRTIRLKRAAQLLEQNLMTVAEVTYAVGFTDLQYFRECFKKFFQVTPSDYGQHVGKRPVAGDE